MKRKQKCMLCKGRNTYFDSEDSIRCHDCDMDIQKHLEAYLNGEITRQQLDQWKAKKVTKGVLI